MVRGYRVFTIELADVILAKGLRFFAFVDTKREDCIA
jgi:hypothetical protein